MNNILWGILGAAVWTQLIKPGIKIIHDQIAELQRKKNIFSA
jgi:hypothetical protein